MKGREFFRGLVQARRVGLSHERLAERLRAENCGQQKDERNHLK
ncbi:hypothetical protein [Butyricicoccus sp.]|nr:hypothetical protein [Butyricicoccus sp.]